MKLSREIFWDTNYDTIDWDKSYQWVICRVLDRGGIKDWHEIKKYYGIDGRRHGTGASNRASFGC